MSMCLSAETYGKGTQHLHKGMSDPHEHPYIFPTNPLVSPLVHACSINTIGPADFILGTKVSLDGSAMRGVPPCILHTFQSVYTPYGQWPAPIGSWRVVYL